MDDTYTEDRLFATHTYHDNPWHKDGTFKVPRVSQALADLVAGDWDVTDFREDRKPNDHIPNPTPDVRERAEFLYGLSELLSTMMRVGEVEHTNDWDWFVQVQTSDGVWHGDYYKDGVAQDWETTPDDDIRYCDTFHADYGTEEKPFYQMGIVPEAQDYYAGLEIVLESWDGGQKVTTERLKVGDISRIIISQR